MASATSRTPYGSRPEPKSLDGHEPQRSGNFARDTLGLGRGSSLRLRPEIHQITAMTWALLTEAIEGGWGFAGHANTNAELVDAARARIAELQRAKEPGG